MSTEIEHQTAKKSVCCGFRIEPETYSLQKQAARNRGMDVADIIRELIRRELARLSYLSAQEKKDLGVGGELYER